MRFSWVLLWLTHAKFILASVVKSCSTVDFASLGPYHPVIKLPLDYHVHDFSKSNDPLPDGTWSVGKYNEVRPTLYDTPMFHDPAKEVDGFKGKRDVHIGIDLGGPVDTPVHAWFAGVVLYAGYNPDAGDYGNVLVTEHSVGSVAVYALYGHLNSRTLDMSPVGRTFEKGEELGGRSENGGWPPHVHFQLSLARPETHDLPGVVSRADLPAALEMYPDPRLVLGDLY